MARRTRASFLGAPDPLPCRGRDAGCATWPNDRLLLYSGVGAFGLVASFLARRWVEGDHAGGNLRLLAVALRGTQQLERVGAHTLAITQSEGFLHDPCSAVVRDPKRPFAAGDAVTLSGMRATVAEVLPDGRPRRALFRFDEPLDSPALAWVRWEGKGYVRAAPPRQGETITLPPIDFFEALTGEKPRGRAPDFFFGSRVRRHPPGAK